MTGGSGSDPDPLNGLDDLVEVDLGILLHFPFSVLSSRPQKCLAFIEHGGAGGLSALPKCKAKKSAAVQKGSGRTSEVARIALTLPDDGFLGLQGRAKGDSRFSRPFQGQEMLTLRPIRHRKGTRSFFQLT